MSTPVWANPYRVWKLTTKINNISTLLPPVFPSISPLLHFDMWYHTKAKTARYYTVFPTGIMVLHEHNDPHRQAHLTTLPITCDIGWGHAVE